MGLIARPKQRHVPFELEPRTEPGTDGMFSRWGGLYVRRRTLREQRAELACGEIFQGAKASVEFGEAGPALRGLG